MILKCQFIYLKLFYGSINIFKDIDIENEDYLYEIRIVIIVRIKSKEKINKRNINEYKI